MGISGLLPVLKSCSRPVHVREYRGCKVVVDGYSWLHKGAYTCARELCEGIYTDRFVQFCLSRVELLRQNGVLVTVVLDGGRLPMKAEEEDTRKKSRRENLEKARTHLLAGNVSAAEDCYQKAVGISSNMAKQLIEALKDIGVPFIVAPYEADAQMCYLSLIGEAHTVITEDSDLLAYGCERVLYKLDRSGHGEEICLADLPRNKGLSFVGFSHNMFLEMCIMAGCDFLPNLPGIGIKKAHGHLKKLRSFLKVVKSLRFSGVPVPRDYEVRFQMVLWVFRHQRVYCPKRRECVHVRPLPPGGLGAADVDVPAAVPRRKQGDAAGKTRLEGCSGADVCTTAGSSDDLADQGQQQQENGKTGGGAADPEQEDLLSFLGPMMPADVAKGVAQGDLQPSSKQPYDLAQIYQGCPTHRMPAGVQRLLFPKPTTDSTTHAAQHQPQQQHHQWRAHTHRPQKQAVQQQGKLAIHGREGGNKQIATGVASKSEQGLGKQGGAGVGKAAGRLPQLLVAMTQHQVQHQQHLLQQQQAERLRQSSARAITAPFVRPSRSRPAETSGGGASGGASMGAVGAASKGGASSGAAGAADAGKAAASGQARNSGTSSSGCSPSKSKPQAAQQAGEIPFRVLVATSSVKAAAAAKHSATNRVSYASRSAGVPAGAQGRGSAAAATAAGASSGTATRSAGVQGGARVSGLSKTKLGQGRQKQQQQQQQQKQQQLLPLHVLSGPRARKEAAAAAAPAPNGAGKTGTHQSVGGPPPKRQRTEPSPLRRLLQQHQQEPQLPAAHQHASPDARPPLPQLLKQQQQQQQQHASPAAQHQLQQERQHQPGPPKPHNGGEPTGLGRQNINAPAAFVAATSTSTDESAQGPDSDTAAAAETAAATAAALDPPTVPAPHTPHRSPLSHFPSISDGDLDNSQLQAMLQDSQEHVISETTEEADLEAPAPLRLAQQPLLHNPTHHHHHHHHHHHKHQQHQEHHHNQHKTQDENHAVHHLSHHHHHKQQGANAGSCTTLRAPLRDISNTAWGEQGARADEQQDPATAAGVSTAVAATTHGAGKGQQQQQQGRSKPMPALSALGFRASGVSSSQMEGMGGSQLSQQTSSMDLCGFAAHAAAAPPTTHQRPSVTSAHRQHKPVLHPIYQHHHHNSHHHHHHHHHRHRHHSFHQHQQCPQEFPKQDDDEGGSEPEVILPEDAVEDPLPVGVSEGGLAGGDDDNSPGASEQLSDSSVESWEGVGRGTAARMRALLRGGQLGEREVEAGGITSEEGEGPSQQQQQRQQQGRQLLSSFSMDGAATANVSKDQQDDGSMPSSKRRRTHSTRSVPVAQQLFGPIATNGRPTELQQQQQQQQQQQGRQLFDSFAIQRHPRNCQHPNAPQQQQRQQVHIGQDSKGGQAANNNSNEDMAVGAGQERGPEHAAKGSGSSGSFHSVGYVKQYGEVAARAIDQVMGEAGAGADGSRDEEDGLGRVRHGGAETGTGEGQGVPLAAAVANDLPEGSEQEGVVGQLPCAFVDGHCGQAAATDVMLHRRAGPLEGACTPSGLAQASESEGEFAQGLQDACPNGQLLLDCAQPPQPCLLSSAPASLAQQAQHVPQPLQHQHQHSKAQRRTPPSQARTIDALLQRQAHLTHSQQHHSSKQHKQPPLHVRHNPFIGLMHTPPPLPQHQHPDSKLLPPTAPGSKSARKPSTAVARVQDTKKGGEAKTKAKGTSGFALSQREEGPSVFVAHTFQKPGSREGKVGLLGGLG